MLNIPLQVQTGSIVLECDDGPPTASKNVFWGNAAMFVFLILSTCMTCIHISVPIFLKSVACARASSRGSSRAVDLFD
jgi:hypothetical protein